MSRTTYTGPLTAVITGLAIALAVTACSSAAPNGSASGDAHDTAPQRNGTVLHVHLANHAWTNALVEHLPEFEAATGYSVEVTQLEQQQLEDQYAVKLNAGSSDIDVMMWRSEQVTQLYARNGYVSDLTSYIEDSPDWAWDDVLEPMRELMTVDGKILGVPVCSETEVIFYRKDLLAAAGLEPPATLDELEAQAKLLKEQNPGMAGFVARTTASGAVTMFSSYLYSHGGTWNDSEGNATLDTPEAREAYDLYSRLLRDYGPDNVTTDMEWTDALALFASGQSVFYSDTSSNYGMVADPDSSQIVDDVGVVPFPAGSAGAKPFFIPAYALGVSEFSDHKDGAWEFVKWATSKEMMIELQKVAATGTRESALRDEESLSALPQDLRDAFIATIDTGQPYDRPQVVDVNRAREIVGRPLAVAIAGGDLDDALKQANVEYQALLDSENK